LPRREKLKPRKPEILGRNLTKNFRELLEETRSSITMATGKTIKMETDRKTKKVFQKIFKLFSEFKDLLENNN